MNSKNHLSKHFVSMIFSENVFLPVLLRNIDFKKKYKSFLFICLSSSSIIFFSSVQFSSASQSYPSLCDPMNRSTPGLPVRHQLPESTQTHVRVSDAIQPSHPLLSPSPPAPNPYQYQSLFQ